MVDLLPSNAWDLASGLRVWSGSPSPLTLSHSKERGNANLGWGMVMVIWLQRGVNLNIWRLPGLGREQSFQKGEC